MGMTTMSHSTSQTKLQRVRVGYLSDIHNESSSRALVDPIADIGIDLLLVAGDVDGFRRHVSRVETLSGSIPNVVSVAGNHEFYNAGVTIDDAVSVMRDDACKASERSGRCIRFLENEVAEFNIKGRGVQVIGATLWTDMALNGNVVGDSYICHRAINDYSAITGTDGRPLKVSETIERHERSVAYINEVLASPFDGVRILLTHHLISRRCIARKYRKFTSSAAFASHRDDLLKGGIQLAVMGHTHSAINWKTQDGILVKGNPKGRARGGINENINFRAPKTILLPK